MVIMKGILKRSMDLTRRRTSPADQEGRAKALDAEIFEGVGPNLGQAAHGLRAAS